MEVSTAADAVPAVIAGDAAPAVSAGSAVRRVVSDYLELTKPKVQSLLLLTTVTTMEVAGNPSLGRIALACLGGYLSAGGAGAINHWYDRDIDALMRRTSRRPLAASGAKAAIRPGEALVSGIVLGAAATLLLGLTVNWLAAALADGAILFYVFVYTIGLKRRTASNIVIGGAAGCFPVLVGWAAVTGTVGLPAIVLFAVIFLWTPPHFWALAMKFRDDYAAASVPMLPVVAPPATVARKILVYSYAMVAATLVLTPDAGWLYGGCAAVLGAWFLVEAHRLRGRISAGDAPAPMRLFHLSIAYLTLLFTVIAGTALLPFGHW